MKSLHARLCLVLSAMLLAPTIATAQFATVTVDGLIIDDNTANDLDLTVGVVEFNSVTSGWTTFSGYDFSGRVELVPGASATIGLVGGDVLRLTDFVAEVPTGGAPGIPVVVTFQYDYPAPITTGGDAEDLINAFSDDSTGTALTAGEDSLNRWQGYVATVAGFDPVPTLSIGSLPTPNVAGLNQPYAPVGHDGLTIAAGDEIRGFRGELEFTLGGVNNQFLLYTSAEVGYTPIPEPTSLALLGIGGLIITRRRPG